ncbi:MAG TPA: MBL fold metallo-hydrolase [Gemmatimonadaceae bacterium]|jgi:phosphoribosyl 1,2-cyclic phosphodiesterase|nr:MBL fold metallo-hydrolase [Gemmatimonadaceae bacterium]
MTLHLRFWGTRGSVPTPGARTVRYGGNTPCVEVRTATGWLIILDAGTGIRELGRALMSTATADGIAADIFLTHAHWDHIQGIPFFAPIFERGNHFTIWGSDSLQTSVDRVIRDQMSPVVFPVAFDKLGALIDFREIAEESLAGSGYEVAAIRVQHPGGALGYRFTDAAAPDSSFVYISDNELAAGDGPWRSRLVEFVRGAKVLIHDATYTAEEYDQHRGWGHSTCDEAVALALDAGVGELVLFHHKPERADDEIDVCTDACRELAARSGRALRITAAAEGMTLVV